MFEEHITWEGLDVVTACSTSPPSLTDHLLQSIDAMEQHEDLTDLGFHLADLPVEPHLGKMVLCAVVLKCLDPILTIACTLAYRDPFILPAEGSKKKAALHCRKHFASSSFSDHMALLRAFQVSQNVFTTAVTVEHNEMIMKIIQFCSKPF